MEPHRQREGTIRSPYTRVHSVGVVLQVGPCVGRLAYCATELAISRKKSTRGDSRLSTPIGLDIKTKHYVTDDSGTVGYV